MASWPQVFELLFYSLGLTMVNKKWDYIGIKVGASHLFSLNEKGNRYLFKSLLDRIGEKEGGGELNMKRHQPMKDFLFLYWIYLFWSGRW